MEWDFIFHPDEKYLETETRGDLDVESLNSMTKEVLFELHARNWFKCILDCHEIGKIIGVLEFYDCPKEITRLGIPQNYKVCLLIKKEHHRQFRFVENVFVNRGFDYRIFTDRESAVAFISA